MASDIVRIKVSADINQVGSEQSDVIEIDRSKWDAMSEDDRRKEIFDAALEMLGFNFWHEEVE